MKNNTTLKGHTIIYDNDCPLCNVYTNAFVKFNFLDSNGRKPFNEIHSIKAEKLDIERAKNEIPLIDKSTGKITYGINSLLKILKHRWPVFQIFESSKMLTYTLKKLYSFVSYNRKVIVPGNPKTETCTPDFNLKYRLLYLAFCWLLTALTLFLFNQLLTSVIPTTTFGEELLIAGGQLLFQGMWFLKNYDKATAFNYWGNLMTVSLMGSIVLWVPILISFLTAINTWLPTGYFLIIASLMFLEHFRRVKLLQLPVGLCITWALYRLLLLIILL